MPSQNGTMLRALAGGAIGASTVTAIHESVRRMRSDAPRMDVLGMRALAKTMRAAHVKPPARDRLHHLTLGGDLLANALFYSMVGSGRSRGVWLRGALLGLSAGIGAVLLPPVLGLGSRPSARTPQTKAMSVALYLAGGLAAAAASRMLAVRQESAPRARRSGDAVSTPALPLSVAMARGKREDGSPAGP